MDQTVVFPQFRGERGDANNRTSGRATIPTKSLHQYTIFFSSKLEELFVFKRKLSIKGGGINFSFLQCAVVCMVTDMVEEV
jgi:hypothetical protein